MERHSSNESICNNYNFGKLKGRIKLGLSENEPQFRVVIIDNMLGITYGK